MLSTPAVGADQANTFEAQFRESQFDNNLLIPTVQGKADQLRPDKDGLHMVSAPGQLVNNLGFSPKFKVRGDFEVTAAFTVARAGLPADGFGAGAVIQVNTPDPASAVFGRLYRKDGKQVISTFVSTGAGEQRQTATRMFPTTATNLQFRLKRTGKTLAFQVAEPPSDEFRTLASVPFDVGDITLLRCGLQQSHADTDVEVVWHDLQIHADELPNRPDALAAGEKQHRPRLQYKLDEPFPWGWASSTVILAVLFLAYWWRQRTLQQ